MAAYTTGLDSNFNPLRIKDRSFTFEMDDDALKSEEEEVADMGMGKEESEREGTHVALATGDERISNLSTSIEPIFVARAK